MSTTQIKNGYQGGSDDQALVDATGALKVSDSTSQSKLDTINTSIQVATRSSTSTITSVSASATNVTLLALNTNRRAAYFFNDSSSTLYLKFGTTATTSSYTVQLIGQAFYEMPDPIYTGEIDGIWSSAVGNVRITELT